MKRIIKLKKNILFIKEFRHLGISPSQEKKIINRVLNGEDIRIVNLNIIRENYQNIKKAFPYAKIYAATKAVSTKGMLKILKEMDSGFEVATVEELQKLIQLNIDPKHILFSHPDKDSLELDDKYTKCLKAFVSDSVNDMEILAKQVPEAKVVIRISSYNNEQNFGIRFGTNVQDTKKLLKVAKKLNLQPVGLTFHVGTQTETVKVWEKPIKIAGRIFREMEKENIILDTLNLGGGFPALFTKKLPTPWECSKAIKIYLKKYFKHRYPKNIAIEPGRGISGTAGLTVGRVINTKYLNKNTTSEYIVTLSIGRFNAGLIGVGQKMVFYTQNKNRHFLSTQHKKHIPGSVYGKACAHLDIVHITPRMRVPKNLKSGDIVVCLGTGAYASQMSSEWCGKKIPTDIIFDSQRQTKLQFKKIS